MRPPREVNVWVLAHLIEGNGSLGLLLILLDWQRVYSFWVVLLVLYCHSQKKKKQSNGELVDPIDMYMEKFSHLYTCLPAVLFSFQFQVPSLWLANSMMIIKCNNGPWLKHLLLLVKPLFYSLTMECRVQSRNTKQFPPSKLL